jgi:histidine phosphotransfer protein HptB
MPDDEPIVIRPDSVSARLLPAFLERRIRDLAVIDDELARNGFRVIERLGHNMKGVGRSYGFDGITDIGAAIEQAGRDHDADEIRRQAAALVHYLGRVKVLPT